MFKLKEQVFLGSVRQLKNAKWEVELTDRQRKFIHRKEFDSYKQAVEYRDKHL